MVSDHLAPARRLLPATARLPVLQEPLRVALAPLAWLLAVVDVVMLRPSVLVAAAVLVVCLPGPVQEVGSSGYLTVADLAAAAVVAVAAARLLTGDRMVGRRAWLPFAAALASFAVAAVIATDISESVRGFVRYAELFVLVPVAVAMAIRDRFDVLLVAGAIVGTTVFEGSVGVWQYFSRTGASYAGEYIRAVGTFGAEQIQALGALVSFGILVTLALGLAVGGIARIGLLTTAALLTLPLMFSFSRGSWIATAGAVLVMLVVLNWRIAAAVAGVAVLTVAVLSLGAGGAPATMVQERLTSIVSSGSEPDRSVQDRYALWSTAVEIWTDHPVVGTGLKDFDGLRDSYAPMSLSAGSDVDDPVSGFRRQPLLSPHNQYLLVLSEQGLMGIGTFGGLLATLTVGALRRRPEVTRSLESRFFDLLAPAVMAWILVDFTYGDVGGGPTAVVLAISLGLVARRSVVVPRLADSRRAEEPR